VNEPLIPAADLATADDIRAAGAPPPAAGNGRWTAIGTALLAVLAVGAMLLAWNTQQRLKGLESELVRRQQDSSAQSAEARTLARESQTVSRDAAAKLALLEARVAESSLQRSQIEELIQSLSRSRDENVLADVEAAIRVALQQSALTGSAEPLVTALKQTDERLARLNQPRLERVRRAVAHDLDRVRAVGVSDLANLTIRLDEAVRLVDDLPLLSAIDRRTPPRDGARDSAKAASAAASASSWGGVLSDGWQGLGEHIWHEARSLLRVTRIEQPEAMLLAPEQAFFLRENLKLRLLNARLSLLSRQFETAQSDLREAQIALDRYFDRDSRRVVLVSDLVRQVAAQARQVNLPRPDETLAAIAAASAGR
jgi:uroporphyrin-3 C-methyltransferase